MVRDEIIKNLSNKIHKYDLNISYSELLDIVDFVINNYEPELPKDINKAARDFAKTKFISPFSSNPEEEVTIIEPDKLEGFKAGAKWMARLLENNYIKK